MSYEARIIYYFKCKKCGHEKRQSVSAQVAGQGICKKCRYPSVPENQESLFQDENKD